MKKTFFLLILICLRASLLSASEEDIIPISYKGRFRPFEAYTKLWLHEITHSEHIKKESLAAFPFADTKNLIWRMHFLGSEPWNDVPWIWIGSASLKSELGLNPKKNRFSYNELNGLNNPHPELKKILENYILATLLSLNMLPDTLKDGEWHSLRALKATHNFTKYPEKTFRNLQELYLKLERAVLKEEMAKIEDFKEKLAVTLIEAYNQHIAEEGFKKAHGKTLYYPSLLQLKAERFYTHYPWVLISVALYVSALVFLFLSLFKLGTFFLIFAFMLHTIILALRCYILGRPPVSNMFETIIYVPWIAVFFSILISFFSKNKSLLIASSLLSALLLILLEITHLNSQLENVQAVLDSQFWLIIHVLMVVGSYGLFALSATLGHLYLLKKSASEDLAKLILQSMYLGVALLIPGTILGGIWAAQSWGRFWDWDPKESWAFISSCVYLMWIHAYRFHHIGYFGLAIGSIVGFSAISFTWYGVNYILGTGLHSYGFGNGGEIYYYAFLLFELIFITVASLKKHEIYKH